MQSIMYFQNIKSWFSKWAYPNSMINAKMKKDELSVKRKKKESCNKGVPIVVTNHPILKSLEKINQDSLDHLYLNGGVKEKTTP